MVTKKFMLSLLSIFIATVMMIVFLQYNSNSNINTLIEGNQELLSKFLIKTKIQRLLADLTFISTEERKMINENVRQGRNKIDERIKIVGDELAYLNKIGAEADSDTKQKLYELERAVDGLLGYCNNELDIFYQDINTKPEVLLAYGKADTLRNEIAAISNYLTTSKDDHLLNLIALADQKSKEAKKWGITLATLAIVASVFTFWYINKKVTVQETLIKKLNESEKKVKEAASIKENFMANMSHEIRTPMNAILGFIHLLQKQDHDAKSKEFISSIQGASENLLTIVNDILDFSKIEAGMMRIEASRFSLRELVHSVKAMFVEKANEKGILLSEVTDSTIPDGLNGDAARLTQIIVNLIGNSIKFTSSGRIELAISKHSEEGETVHILFAVKDTGIGIAKDKIASVFERFNQADENTTRKYGGTGLGLAIVKQLVDLQHGSVWVESEEGKGSRFVFIIPYKIMKQENWQTKAAPPLNETITKLNKSISVLAVEDNVMNQNLMSHLLADWGMQFTIAANGAQAIEAVRTRHFDLILMDIQMPGMNGYTATGIIRNELHLDIPIVAMTAHAMAGEREKCLSYGMNEYIAKPVKEEELYKIINALTRQHLHDRTNPGTAQFISALEFHTIDLQYLQELTAGKKSFQINLTSKFVTQLPEELQALEAAFSQNDYEKVRQLAHNMQTSVSFMGLTEKLRIPLSYIEEYVFQERESKTIANHFLIIKTVCLQALEEAQSFLNALKEE